MHFCVAARLLFGRHHPGRDHDDRLEAKVAKILGVLYPFRRLKLPARPTALPSRWVFRRCLASPAPAPRHLWRTMVSSGMTPNTSDTTLATRRYAVVTLEVLMAFFEGRPIRREYLIVDKCGIAGTGAQSHATLKRARRASARSRLNVLSP